MKGKLEKAGAAPVDGDARDANGNLLLKLRPTLL
jgi:hypothetical protein